MELKMIFIIKVTTNKEERALDMISDRAEKRTSKCILFQDLTD